MYSRTSQPIQPTPSSMAMAGALASRMSPSSIMMAGGNPYGPSGPPPPGLSSQMAMGSTPMPAYPSSHHPSAMGVGMPPKPLSGGSGSLNTIQLQQLSAQIKTYKLLSRNLPPPEALMSIVHGRKPTPAMLAALSGRVQPGSAGSPKPMMGHSPQPAPSSQSVPSPKTPSSNLSHPGASVSGVEGPATSSSLSASSGGKGSNISLYPLSPSVGPQGASPRTPQQQQQQQQQSQQTQSLMPRSTSSLTQNLSTATSAAPNVTISASGGLPYPVRQAMSAAQAGSTSQAHQQQTSQTGMSSSATVGGHGVQSSHEQQKQQMHVKQVKLLPSSKPPGIDPVIIVREREARYVCVCVCTCTCTCTYSCKLHLHFFPCAHSNTESQAG